MEAETLTHPIDPADPCGADLSFSPQFDTIAELRREDDPSLPLGDWKEKGKEPKVADWEGVCTVCETLLRQRSKDLRLAGWLTEGWAQRDGLPGLARGLRLTAALLQRHWDGVHPRADGDDYEQRVGALAWQLGRVAGLVRRVREATAPRPATHAGAQAALQALAALQEEVDHRLGDDGPSFVGARDALKALADDLPADLPADAGPGADAAGAASAAAGAPAATVAGPLQTRAQALQQLRQVAEFFRQTEPHSPVAYLADKAARWGAMDLHAWLRTVVKDGGSLAHLEELLGVEPPGAAR